MRKYFYLLTALALLSGCTDNGPTADKPFLDTSWNLKQLFSENIQYSGSQTPHLRFEADRVTGNDGCNNFFGPYKKSDDDLSFGLLASTRMACPQIDGFELVFNKMLLATTRFRIDGNRLELYADEQRLASFVAVEQN